ncbi:hypothetical protein CRES_2097 [Corynebacterium resistens DSM 45100]|uniref:Uncharacterized protein n=1 Tax=Corynebacterium resistens (strain DSM 45100 / JCM 12819 / GTC 2026 / SICGH 158) TaxID=662755 RepID=F8E3C4_CORRG|nr:hypothetical protein CRES_2097 [Corynebacterium resistens DSM 45100]
MIPAAASAIARETEGSEASADSLEANFNAPSTEAPGTYAGSEDKSERTIAPAYRLSAGPEAECWPHVSFAYPDELPWGDLRFGEGWFPV